MRRYTLLDLFAPESRVFLKKLPNLIHAETSDLTIISPTDPLLKDITHNTNFGIFINYLKVRGLLDHFLRQEAIKLRQKKEQLIKRKLALMALWERQAFQEMLDEIEFIKQERIRRQNEAALERERQALTKKENDIANAIKAIPLEINNVINLVHAQKIQAAQMQPTAFVQELVQYQSPTQIQYFRNIPDENNLAFSRDLLDESTKMKDKIKQELKGKDGIKGRYMFLLKQRADILSKVAPPGSFTGMHARLRAQHENPELRRIQAEIDELHGQLIEINAQIDASRKEKAVLPINLAEKHGIKALLKADPKEQADFQQFYQSYENETAQSLATWDYVADKLEAYKARRWQGGVKERADETLRLHHVGIEKKNLNP